MLIKKLPYSLLNAKIFHMKKKVIAYLHTHWDREWYREYEVFRLRLLRVFDNVLDMIERNKIPSFYFDGQVSALLDYLELRPEKETLIRRLIAEKKLFIGPFYTLVDEFLTDKPCFEKNLEIGLKISRDFGCEDFIGYFADTFGHSKNITPLIKKYGINKAMVWRGVPKHLPAEFVFNGVNTVNLVRGYFMDIFSAPVSINEKAEFLRKNLDMIAEKSSNVLLLPIGADHLGVEHDIAEQIEKVNAVLENYEIILGSPFDYFDEVTFEEEWNDELRDNSATFILPGCYSARTKLKQYNTKCSYMLEQADKVQKHYGGSYNSAIEYAYKLLLQNQAHDGICGCSTDLTARENITRYEKIMQIAKTIIEELRLKYNFETPIIESTDKLNGYDVISEKGGFENTILYDTQKIPVTEDYKTIYTLKKQAETKSDIDLKVIEGRLFANDIEIEFVRYIDNGDTYNYGPLEIDKGEEADIYSFDGKTIKTSFFDVSVDYGKRLVNFKINWNNNKKNHIWQVKFNLKEPVTTTCSEDMNELIERKFDPDYDIRKNLPKTKGLEAKTNTAPMQRLVWAQGFGIITKGLNEYEVNNNSLLITILRSVGVISNPKNSARSTPAGPPLETPDAQQLGENTAEFSLGFFPIDKWQEKINELYPQIKF